LEPPEFPVELSQVWSAFLDLNPSRPQGFSGPLGLPYTEIKSYMELTDTPMTPLEVSVLKKLDQTYLKVANG